MQDYQNAKKKLSSLYGVVAATGEIRLVASVTRTAQVRRRMSDQVKRDLYYKRLSEMIPCSSRDFEGICLITMKPCTGVCYEGSEEI